MFDRQNGAGAGNQLRQCRRDLARLCLALGRSWHSAEGDQVAVDEARPAGGAAEPSIRICGRGCSRCCATARRTATRSTRRAWCRSPNTAATCCGRCAQSTGIAYDERSQGTLQLFRTQKQLDGTGGDIEVLKQFGVPSNCSIPTAASRPSRRSAGVREKIVGGLRLPGDETGDCKMFTDRLAELCVERGVTFEYGTQIGAGQQEPQSHHQLSAPTSVRRMADAYVVALGSYSPRCMRQLGRPIPVYPVKGYSITVPITDAAAAPVSTVMDETYKVAITRLGDRIRVGGTAEISGYDLRLHESRRRTLEHSVGDLFPNGGDLKKATFWCGLRPMTPDGPPMIGRTKLPNLYLNTGHGTLGWTMACGSAKVLADIISGKKPDIDASQLGPQRYG